MKEDSTGQWMDPAFEAGLVSVIIPTYNRAALLPATLESLVLQSYRPLEVIVADDGSSDDTGEVMERWTAEGGRSGVTIRYLRQPNRGAPSARNLGLIGSRGEFIQFLDSDDLLSERKIELCVQALREDAGLQLVYGPTELLGVDGNPEYPGLVTEDPGRVLEAACVRSVWTIMGPLYRRKLCVRAGPWLEEMSCWQDREYALRVLALSPGLRFVPGAVSYYRVGHGPSIGDNWSRDLLDLRSIRAGAEAAARAIESGCGLTPRMRENLARHLAHVGRLLGQLGETEEGHSALRSAREIARGTGYARTVSTLRVITSVAGFRLTNRCIALRARLLGRPATAPA